MLLGFRFECPVPHRPIERPLVEWIRCRRRAAAEKAGRYSWRMARAKKPTELPLKKAFGRTLKDIRERRDLSQKQLADLLGTDVMQISRYERGIGLPSLETCVHLAAILKVSTDELLLGREPHGAELEISDVRLLDKFQRLQQLNKRDREAVIILTSTACSPVAPSSRRSPRPGSHVCLRLPQRRPTQRAMSSTRVCREADHTERHFWVGHPLHFFVSSSALSLACAAANARIIAPMALPRG